MTSLQLPLRIRLHQAQVEVRHLLSDFKIRALTILITWAQIPFLILAFASTPAQAVSTSEVVNGGTCIAYPPYNTAAGTFTGLSYQHWLYGFDGIAFCHLEMPQDWPVTTLSYVLYHGSISAGVLRARLCVHSGTVTVTCGPESTIGAGGFPVNWVAPPAMPPSASGAFVQFTFRRDGVALVFQLIPVWIK